METDNICVRIGRQSDVKYAAQISEETFVSAQARGTGISRRSPAMIAEKLSSGKAVIALTKTGEWVGFSYFEVWAHGEFVSNSGLIVAPEFRNLGVAHAIKEQVFELSRKQYPNAKIFSITTGIAIMRMNARLGFETVTFDEIPHDPAFWEGCRSCVNHHILQSKGCRNCFCTAMLFTPDNHQPLICDE